MHIAVVGCGHGEIDKIYDVVESIEKTRNIKVSLVLCCGDFQSVRNMTDLRCMACPIKYQAMHDFHRYYSGEKKAPVLTLFIGGNHEASNFLQELPYGGWVAPNIYFMGNSGVVRLGSVRIVGISGIYKGHDYLKGRHEAPPYDQGTMRSVYHYRNLDIFRLKQLSQPVDIVLSHDWPKGIHQYGNTHQLLRRKPFFREEIERNEFGSRPLHELMEKIQPNFWFSAHMHVKFAAYVPHNATQLPVSDNVNEGSVVESHEPNESEKITKFLALDKVLPRRQFLQIIKIPSTDSINLEDVKLEHDPEWLAILKSTNHLLSVKSKPIFMPGPGCQSRFDYTPTSQETEEVSDIFEGDFAIPAEGFCQTGYIYTPEDTPQRANPLTNPQTKDLCQKLGIDDPVELITEANVSNPLLREHHGESSASYESFMPSQLDVTLNRTSFIDDSLNPDEISLDINEEDDVGTEQIDDENKKDEKIETHTRSRLILPPPKCPADSLDFEEKVEAEDEETGTQNVNAAELELLRSVMGNAEEGSTEGLFFIDTAGEEPSSKRRKDLGSMKY